MRHPEASAELLAAFREAVRAGIRRKLREEEALAAELRAAVIPALREEIARLRAEGRCGPVYLFGSFAWGRPTPESDIDLLVDGDADELASRVDRATSRDVHALRFDEAPESLRVRALAEGVAL